MRNKLLILLLSFLFINSTAVATTFNFEAKNLEIMESGNLITADEVRQYHLITIYTLSLINLNTLKI